MSDVFERAASGRSKCRGCARPIARDELRFGERLPNPFATGEMTLWFHPLCAAYKRPEAFLEALAAAPADLHERERLERLARDALAQRRLPRIDGAERAPTGQAKCRHCGQPIERGSWRIRLAFYEEGQLSPAGFVHLACRREYFGTGEIAGQLLHFSPDLGDAEREELRRACGSETGTGPR